MAFPGGCDFGSITGTCRFFDISSLTLATRNTSSFIFNPPPLPEVTALQSWCAANSAKIRELPIAPAPQLPMPKANEHSEDDITKIANLPISVDKVEELRAESQQSSVIGHNWMLQGSFNRIFSPANICYGGDGIRTWNEEAVSRCTLFSSQVSQYATDGLEGARDNLTEAAAPFATIAQTSFREHALAGVALACEEADTLCI